MAEVSQKSITSEEWLTVRDFTTGGSGDPLPKYEAKFVDDAETEFVDDELVLVKETSSFGSERTYHVPREVIEEVSHVLPK